MSTLSNLANRNPPPPNQVNPEIPADFSLLLQKLIAKSPHDRPGSAPEVVETLHTLESQLSTITIPDDRPERTELLSTPSLPSIAQSSSERKKRSLLWQMFLFTGGALALLMAVVIYRIQTDYGTFIVTLDESADIEAKLKKDGLVIEDLKSGRRWQLAAERPQELPSGDYDVNPPAGLQLLVKDDAGTEFTTTDFKIKRGETTSVRVTLSPILPPKQEVPSPTSSPVVAAAPMTFDDLDPAQIPASERSEELPPETVAVMGTRHGKTWGSQFWVNHGNMSFSPDGKWICASDSSSVYVFDSQTFELKKRIGPVSQFLIHRWIAFSPDSQRLYTPFRPLASGSGNSMTDLTSPTLETQTSPERFGSAYIVANSPDGQLTAMRMPEEDSTPLLGKRDESSGDVSGLTPIADVEGQPAAATLGRISDMAFSPDGQWLIAAHVPGGYRVFRKTADSFLPVAVIPAQMNQYGTRVVYSFTPERQVALLQGFDICLQVDLSLPADQPIPESGLSVVKAEILHHCLDIATSADGQRWAAARNENGSIPVFQGELLVGDWKDGSPRLIQSIPVPGQMGGQVALSPQGDRVAVMADRVVLRVFDLTSFPPVEQTHSVYQVSTVSGNGAVAFTCSSNGEVQRGGIVQGKFTTGLTQKLDYSVIGSPINQSGTRGATISRGDGHIPLGHRVKIWNLEDNQFSEVSSLQFPPDMVYTGYILFSKERRLLFGNEIWDVGTAPPRLLAKYAQVANRPSAMALSDDEQLLGLVNHDGKMSIYRVDGPVDQPLASVQIPSSVTSMTFSHDQTRLATTHNGEGFCIVWKIDKDQITELARIPNPSFYHTMSAVFARDDSSVFVAGVGHVVEWKLDENKLVRDWPIPGWAGLTLSDDGRYLTFSNSNFTNWILRIAP